MKKIITLFAVLGLVLALAPAAQAAPVVYTLTVDGGVLLGGTLTFDTDYAPCGSNTGGPSPAIPAGDYYTQTNGAIVDFSFFRAGSAESFDKADGGFLTLTMATGTDTPLALWFDIDSGGDFIFIENGWGTWPYKGGGLNFTNGLGQYEPGTVNVTGAALTPPTPPAGTVIIFK